MTEETMRLSLDFVRLNTSDLPEEYLEEYSRSAGTQELFDEAESQIDEKQFTDVTETIREIENTKKHKDEACRAFNAIALLKDIEDLRDREKIEEAQIQELEDAERLIREGQDLEAAERIINRINNQVTKNLVQDIFSSLQGVIPLEELIEIFVDSGSFEST